MPEKRLASLDVGSNTFRLLIVAASSDGRFEPLARRREIVRIGRDAGRGGRLSAEAMERGVGVLTRFAREIEERRAAETLAVGTQVFRDASNGASFAEEVRRRCGIELRIIDGVEEARLTRLGVLRALERLGPRFEKAVIFDLGGGSCEFSFERAGAAPELASLPLGVAGLTQAAGISDPPGSSGVCLLEREARRGLATLQGRAARARRRPGLNLVGTAGTVTTLAAMELELKEYDPDRVTGFRLSRRSLRRWTERLAALKVAERGGLAGLEAGREEIILAGAVIVGEIMDLFGQEDLLVSDGGLLEGVIFDRIALPAAEGATERRRDG